jgi:hypothetical protein
MHCTLSGQTPKSFTNISCEFHRGERDAGCLHFRWTADHLTMLHKLQRLFNVEWSRSVNLKQSSGGTQTYEENLARIVCVTTEIRNGHLRNRLQISHVVASVILIRQSLQDFNVTVSRKGLTQRTVWYGFIIGQQGIQHIGLAKVSYAWDASSFCADLSLILL